MATRTEWSGRVDRWHRSGLSAREFGAREGINPKRLVWWRWHLRTMNPRSLPDPSEPEVQFLPVRIVDSLSPPGSVGATLEVVLPNGRVVRVPPGFDAAGLDRVLEVASRGERC